MKKLQPKPQFYSYFFAEIQSIAKSMGYNLLLHGSLNRDCDLVAIPWIDEPRSHLELLQALEKNLTGAYHEDIRSYLFSRLGGGRSSYVINLNRRQTEEVIDGIQDEQYYLDISITPLAL